MNIIYSPLEAFHTDIYIHINLLPVVLTKLNVSSMNILTIVAGMYGLVILSLKSRVVQLYIMLRDFFKNQVATSLSSHFITLIYVLVFVGILNVIALIPSNASFTAQLTANLLITSSIVLGSILIGLNIRGIRFFLFFFPSNVPVFIRPLLFVIEILSFVMRAFSMSIRLFANMVAGHSLLHILQGFQSYVGYLAVGKSLCILTLFLSMLIYAWLAFELFVALLQAYVFGLLLLLYVSDLVKI